MKYKDLIYRVKDRIATITLNRPERMNALSPNLEAEMHRAFDEADADRAVKVIVLTGSGNAFCAGIDMSNTSGKTKKRNADPTGKTIAEYIEFWHRNDGARVAKGAHMWQLGHADLAA